ncbi:MAG: pyrroline-5-carboxylate reductase [Porticoccaceae bacterium]
MNQPTLAFVGGGNMATSLIGGLIEKGYPAARITACDPVADCREQLASRFGIVATDDNRHAVATAEVVILAVKPQVMKAVATALRPALGHNPLVISIAAGIPVASLQGWLGAGIPIVRCMPNTPALVQTGASGLFATARVSAAQRQQTEAILSAVGICLWVPREADIDAVTALSGSGPAYFFLVIEAMEQAGVRLGLSPAVARSLTLQTALGAARMALASDVDSAELRRRVTSPGGTTERAIDVFLAGGLPELFDAAMIAARDRAHDMAAELTD